MLVDAQRYEHRQPEPEPGAVELGLVAGDQATALECPGPAQARRRREADGVGEVDVGQPAVAAGRPVAVAAAVVLTLAATNAYLTGAVQLARRLGRTAPATAAAAVRLTTGSTRMVAAITCVAVTTVLAFSGWALVVLLPVTALARAASARRSRRPAPAQGSTSPTSTATSSTMAGVRRVPGPWRSTCR